MRQFVQSIPQMIILVIMLVLLSCFQLEAQPNTFSYQAVMRDADGEIMSNQAIQLRLSVLDESATFYYVELHQVTTNQFGQINVNVGGGTQQSGDFSTIPWGTTQLLLQSSVSMDNGSTFIEMGETPLLAVPYALFAASGNDGPPGNGIASVTDNGDGTITFNFTDGSSFTTPNLTGPLVAGDSLNMLAYDGTAWVATDIIKTDGERVAIGSNPAISRLLVQGDTLVSTSDPIFEVKNSNGNVVFAVYEDGVEVNIDTSASIKGAKGGFAVGGLSTGKVAGPRYLSVTPDSVRIYIEKSTTKGAKGGFAVGGLSTGKANAQDLLLITPDSSRIYFDTASTKKAKGGFAVGGLSTGKSNAPKFLVISPDSARVYVNRETAKGAKGGFAVGGLSTGKGNTNFLDLTPENYFIGDQAGKSNTSGQFNSFIGYKAGFSNTLGNRNTFIGYFSGYANTQGNSNIFIGDSAGYNNVDGYYNIFLGNNAGTQNTNGYQNVFIGNESGYSNDDGTYNVYIGQKTGQSNTSGGRNVIIGATSGYFNTTGSQNVFVGNWSGYYNTSGTNNVFLGNRTGWNNTVGNTNIFIGSYCGFQNTKGSDNIFIGAGAGQESDTCFANIFIGNNSGQNNSAGLANVYLGNRTGNENTSGSNNTILGHESGHYNTEGEANVFVGAYAGYFNYGGNRNVYLGAGAGNRSSGSRNVFIGLDAGYWEDESDKLYIETSDADSSGALIYGDFAENIVRFNSWLSMNAPPDKDYDFTIDNRWRAANIKINGIGDTYNYAAIALSAKDSPTELLWQLTHSMDNHKFKIFTHDGSGWHAALAVDTLGNFDFEGNLTPFSDDVRNIGSSSQRWNTIYATNGTIQTSDKRFKENILSLTYGLTEVLQLKPVTFNWKAIPEHSKLIGLIAQDVIKVIPEIVNVGDDEEKRMGINYSSMTPVLIKAIQEQQEMIEKLEKRIAELEKNEN